MNRYKEDGNNWFIKIFLDIDGNEISRTSFANGKGSGTGLFKEMQEWLKIPGNTIEPQYTAAELKKKKAADEQQTLDSQNSELIRLLDDSEKHVSNDPPYPADVSKWVTSRGKWRNLLKSNTIGVIDPKPF